MSPNAFPVLFLGELRGTQWQSDTHDGADRRHEIRQFHGLPAIYDPYTTCGLQGLQACANGQPTRQPFPGNVIPASRIDTTAAVLMNEFGAPNLPGNVNNFAGNVNLAGNQTQNTTRADYTLGQKHRLFGRYTYWNGHSLPSDPSIRISAA